MDMTKRQADALKNVPKLYASLTERAYNASASPRQAIKAKCQECCGYSDVVNRVRGCTVSNCPLWQYRPYQSDDVDGNEE